MREPSSVFKVTVYDESISAYLAFAVRADTSEEARATIKKHYTAEGWGNVSKVHVGRLLNYGRKVEQIGIEQMKPSYHELQRHYEALAYKALEYADSLREVIASDGDKIYAWVRSMPGGEALVEKWTEQHPIPEEVC